MKKFIFLVLFVSLFIILVGGYTLFRKNHFVSKEATIQKYKYPNSQFVDWEGIKVHLTEQGSGNTSVVLIHGLGGAMHEFKPLAERLAKNYHVVSFDLPGLNLNPELIQDFFYCFLQMNVIEPNFVQVRQIVQ